MSTASSIPSETESDNASIEAHNIDNDDDEMKRKYNEKIKIINKGYKKSSNASRRQYFKQLRYKELERKKYGKEIGISALAFYHIGLIYENEQNIEKAVKYYKLSNRENPKSPQTIKHFVHCMKQQNNDELWMEDEWVKMLQNAYKYGLEMKWNTTQMIETAACCLELGRFYIEYHSKYTDESLLWFERGCNILKDIKCIKVQQNEGEIMRFDESMNDDYCMKITQKLMEQYQRNLVHKAVNEKKEKCEKLDKVFGCNYSHSLTIDDKAYAAGICSNYAYFQKNAALNLREAEKWYVKALEFIKCDGLINVNLGDIYCEFDECDKAFKYYKLALQYCSKSECVAIREKIDAMNVDAETESEDEDILINDVHKNRNHNVQIESVDTETEVVEGKIHKDIFDEMDNKNDEEKQQMRAKMNEIMHGYNQIFGQEPDQISSIKNHIKVFLNEENVSNEEINFMIAYCENNGEDICSNIQNHGKCFVEMMRIQMKQMQNNHHMTHQNDTNYSQQTNEFNDGDEEYIPYASQIQQRRKRQKRVKKKKKQSKEKEMKKCSKSIDNKENISQPMSEWLDSLSAVQRRAFKNRTKNDSEFFYRLNASHIDSDDEKQRDLIQSAVNKKGSWSDTEHRLFMEQVLKIGVNVKWGNFSQAIPGRVGYVCSNYWRALVKNGDVKDLNYRKSPKDDKKISFITKSPMNFKRFAVTIIKDKSKTFKNLPTKHPKHPSDKECEKVLGALDKAVKTSKKVKKRKRKIESSSNDHKPKRKKRRKIEKCELSENDDDDDYFEGIGIKKKSQNPMPSFIDIMTGNVVIEPAISPYGHVLGYESWTTILRNAKHKNQCPFTKQKMTRRSLVKLTVDNIEKYKKDIVNLSEEQARLITL